VRYSRLTNTPNHLVLGEKLATMEGSEAAIVTGSGMAAVTTALLGLLNSGDHLLVQSTVYGGTSTFLTHHAPRFGIEHSPMDVTQPDTWSTSLTSNTRLIYVESIANPLMSVGELTAIVAFAKAHGLVTVIDNTFASPVNFRPIAHGFDVVIHSATKYLNGHSDIIAGVIASTQTHLDPIHSVLNHLGGCLDPHACFLLERGLKTLGIRVRKQNDNALTLAKMLATHPAVDSVMYPGLTSSTGHTVARKLFDGYGGMLAFTPADPTRCLDIIEALRLPVHAPSLGGVESLVVRPAFSSHLGMSPQDRAAAGISDALIRVSVGIEDIDDLRADFDQALASA